jgi:hypothetical protein
MRQSTLLDRAHRELTGRRRVQLSSDGARFSAFVAYAQSDTPRTYQVVASVTGSAHASLFERANQ